MSTVIDYHQLREPNNCPICASIDDPQICCTHKLFINAGPGWALYKHEQQLHTSTRCALENALKRVAQLEGILEQLKDKEQEK